MLNPMKFFVEYIPAIVTLTHPAIVTLNHPAIVTLNHPAAIVTPNSNSNSFHLEQYIKKYIHTLKHSEQAQRQIKNNRITLTAYPVSSLCHCYIKSPCHCYIESPCHCYIKSPCHCYIESPCHCYTESPCHCYTESPCHCYTKSSLQ